jgi:uncharacterized membrane protein
MKKFFRSIAAYSLRGMLFVAPIGITIAVFVWGVRFLNGLISPFTDDLLPFQIPGLGILIIFIWLALLGYLITHLITVSAENWLDRIMSRAPLVKAIYFSVKDIISLFSDKGEKLGKPVKVCIQRDPLQYRFGFVTQPDISVLGFGEEMLSVYLPFSYGLMGMQMAVCRKDVEFLDLPATEVMKFIVSGGVTHVNEKGRKEK